MTELLAGTRTVPSSCSLASAAGPPVHPVTEKPRLHGTRSMATTRARALGFESTSAADAEAPICGKHRASIPSHAWNRVSAVRTGASVTVTVTPSTDGRRPLRRRSEDGAHGADAPFPVQTATLTLHNSVEACRQYIGGAYLDGAELEHGGRRLQEEALGKLEHVSVLPPRGRRIRREQVQPVGRRPPHTSAPRGRKHRLRGQHRKGCVPRGGKRGGPPSSCRSWRSPRGTTPRRAGFGVAVHGADGQGRRCDVGRRGFGSVLCRFGRREKDTRGIRRPCVRWCAAWFPGLARLCGWVRLPQAGGSPGSICR